MRRQLSILTLVYASSQIEEGELSATLSPDGILTFTEDPNVDAFHPKAIQSVLHRAQISGTYLEELNRNILKSKELLNKVSLDAKSYVSYLAPVGSERKGVWSRIRSWGII